MILTLEVNGQQAASLGGSYRREFGSAGGTIGRLPDNDWVLPDAHVSGHHARIRFKNGQFLLEDTSTNGVSVNSPDNRLQRGRPYPLSHGDRLFIDAYQITVSIAAGARAPEPFISREIDPVSRGGPIIPDDPFGEPSPGDPFAPMAQHLEGTLETDPMKLLGLESAKGPPARAPRAADLVSGSPLNDHYRPPAVIPGPSELLIPDDFLSVSRANVPDSPQGLIPSDYDPLAPDDPGPPPTPPPNRPQKPLSAPPLSVAPRVPESAPRPNPAKPRNSPAIQTPRVAPPAPLPQIPEAPLPPLATAPMPTPAPPRRSSAALPSGPTPGPAFGSVPPPPRKGTQPSPVVASPSTGDLDFDALLRGAGLQGVEVSAELASSFGQILRVVIEGLMDVLRARERIKDEFRMRMTTFKTTDNNPLKFSANAEDALHNLLVKRNSAYLGPVEAFEDAFCDVRNHQVAMLAGVRVAYESMLEEFSPERLQAEFDRQLKKGALLAVPARLRYWDLYRERFHDRVRDVDSCFRELFGDEFARAYEEQLEKLRTLQRSTNR